MQVIVKYKIGLLRSRPAHHGSYAISCGGSRLRLTVLFARDNWPADERVARICTLSSWTCRIPVPYCLQWRIPDGWLISHSRGGFKPGLHVRPSGGTSRFLRDLQVGVSTLARSMGLSSCSCEVNLAVGPASKMDLSALYGYIPAGPAGMISRRDTTNLLHPCQVQPSLRSRSASAS